MDSVEMANGKNGNGDQPVRGRRITANDLSKAAEAAKEAAAAASEAAEAVVSALESGEVDEELVGLEEGDGQDDMDQGERSGAVAFEEFMAQLSGYLRRAGANVDVSENARWVKIESLKNGHKVYVAKGKTQVNRIESTIPPDLVNGAVEPDRKNGRIASYIPADPKAVGEAIEILSTSEERIRPPARGGGGRGGQLGGAGGGSRRQTSKLN